MRALSEKLEGSMRIRAAVINQVFKGPCSLQGAPSPCLSGDLIHKVAAEPVLTPATRGTGLPPARPSLPSHAGFSGASLRGTAAMAPLMTGTGQ